MTTRSVMFVLFFDFIASPGIAVRPERALKADTEATAATALADSLRTAYAAAAIAAAAASDSTAAARANIATAEDPASGLASAQSLVEGLTKASVTGRVAALADLAKAAATQTSDPASGLASAQSLVEGLTKDGNATKHMSSENLAVLDEVIKIINSTIYASMDADHRSDKQSLADAVIAVSACHADVTDRQAPSGDIGELEEDAFARQLEQNRLQALLDRVKAENETAWNALVAHMEGLEAGQCTSLPGDRTTTNLDSYYGENSATEQFIAQYIAQQKAYQQKRDVQGDAKTALDKTLAEFESNSKLLRSEYCDWKRVLETACTGYETCYESKSKHLSDLIERTAINKKTRMEVFTAGETIVSHIKFLLGTGKKIKAADVDASRYDLEVPAVPQKNECDTSGLTDSRWQPAISCTSWQILAEGVTYTGKETSPAITPLHYGKFQAFKAVYRGGSGIQCNRAFRSDYKWQTCHRVKKAPGAWSFELKENSDFLVKQPNWATLPPQCKVPDTPTGDIFCDVKFKLEAGDTLTAGWYEPFRRRSLGDNGGSITIDIYGKLS